MIIYSVRTLSKVGFNGNTISKYPQYYDLDTIHRAIFFLIFYRAQNSTIGNSHTFVTNIEFAFVQTHEQFSQTNRTQRRTT